MPNQEPAWHRNLRAARARARSRLQDLAAYELLESHHGSAPPAMSLKVLLKGLGQLLKAQGKGGGKGGDKGGGKGGKPAKKCFCCGAYGHLQKDCTKLEEKCHICKEVGHLAAMCPQCDQGKGGKGKGKAKAPLKDEDAIGKGKGKGKSDEEKNRALKLTLLPRPLCPNKACTHVNLHGAVRCIACKAVLKKMPTYLEAAAKAAEGEVGAPHGGRKNPTKSQKALEEAEAHIQNAQKQGGDGESDNDDEAAERGDGMEQDEGMQDDDEEEDADSEDSPELQNHKKMLELQTKMGYPAKELDSTRAKILQLQQKQAKEAKKACKGVQDNLAEVEAKLAKHVALKEKRIEEHREDVDKIRKKKLAALAHLEEEWKLNKSNVEAEATAETAKAMKAISQIEENLAVHVKEQQLMIDKLKETLPKISHVAYGTLQEAGHVASSPKVAGDVINPGVSYVTNNDINETTFEVHLADNLAFSSLSGEQKSNLIAGIISAMNAKSKVAKDVPKETSTTRACLAAALPTVQTTLNGGKADTEGTQATPGATASTGGIVASGVVDPNKDKDEESSSEDEEATKLNPKVKVKTGIRTADEIKAAAADTKKVSNNKIGKDNDKANEAASGLNGNQKHLKKLKEEQAQKVARENLERQQAAALAMQQAAAAALSGKK